MRITRTKNDVPTCRIAKVVATAAIVSSPNPEI
jgi:hypothetical protein